MIGMGVFIFVIQACEQAELRVRRVVRRAAIGGRARRVPAARTSGTAMLLAGAVQAAATGGNGSIEDSSGVDYSQQEITGSRLGNYSLTPRKARPSKPARVQ
jgi:hypothetical protein